MLLGWDNKADAAALTVGSEQATLPGANLQIAHISRKWQTAAGVKSSSLTFDMLASLQCALLAVLGTNFTAAATVRLRASDADPTAVAGDKLDTGVIASGVKAGYGAIYKAFAAVTARYWRLDLTDNTLPDNLAVGRVFLGPSWAPSANQLYGWSPAALDDSKGVESYGLQSFFDVRPKRRVLDFTLDWMGEAEMYGNAFRIAYENGLTRDMLAIPNINGAYLSEQSVWGLLTASEPLVNRSTNLYRQKFNVKERL
jgi:hypothetical protein